MFWPISQPRTLSSGEHEAIKVFCRRVSLLLRTNADGERMEIPDKPHILPPPRLALARPSPEDEAQAAVRFAERLPAGCCALNLEGEVVFANSAAIDMLGVDFADLKGVRPWEVLPWLRDPTLFEEHRCCPAGSPTLPSPGTSRRRAGAHLLLPTPHRRRLGHVILAIRRACIRRPANTIDRLP